MFAIAPATVAEPVEAAAVRIWAAIVAMVAVVAVASWPAGFWLEVGTVASEAVLWLAVVSEAVVSEAVAALEALVQVVVAFGSALAVASTVALADISAAGVVAVLVGGNSVAFAAAVDGVPGIADDEALFGQTDGDADGYAFVVETDDDDDGNALVTEGTDDGDAFAVRTVNGAVAASTIDAFAMEVASEPDVGVVVVAHSELADADCWVVV